MTARPAQIQARLAGLEDIGQVVGALRAIAAGRAGAARGAMAAVTAYAQTIEAALLAVMATSERPIPAHGPGLLLVVGAAQGFSGSYPARIAEAAEAAMEPPTGLLVVGHRTLEMLRAAGMPVLWSADLPGHPAAIPELASHVTDVLVRLSARHPGAIRAVVGSCKGGQRAETRRLFPPAEPAGASPMPAAHVTTLPIPDLLDGLLQETLFAAVAYALMQGAEAEAEARVEAMARAQRNLRKRRSDVEQEFRQARQEQMTTEMIELTVARMG